MPKPLATNVSTPLSKNFQIRHNLLFFIPGVMWLVSVTRSQVWIGSRCVKFGVFALTLSYWSLEVQQGTSWQRTLRIWKKRIVALHKDGIGYKKIAKTLKLSCSTVAKTNEPVLLQWFNRTGSTQNRPRHDRPNKLSARAQSHIQRLCLGNRCMSAASIAAEVEGVGGQPVCWIQAE